MAKTSRAGIVAAARDLMRDRDPARWDTAIHRLDRKGAIQ